MTDANLLPCPFCGSNDLIEYSGPGIYRGPIRVTCNQCESGATHETWNRRAQPAEVEGVVQCPASHPAECYAPGTQVVHASLVHGIVRQADQYHAALSAVTAERDALLAEREGKVLVPVEPTIE